MKTLYLSILIISAILATVFVNPVLGQISTGGPLQTAHYSFSQMVSSEKNVYVVYQKTDDNGSHYHIFFTKSNDGGHHFGKTIDFGSGVEPFVAAHGNNVYVSWEDGSTGWPPSYVLFAKSIDGGNNFGNSIVLNNATNSSSVITHLVPYGNQLFAVIGELGEQPPYQSDVYLKSSQDNGSTWAEKVELLPSPTFTNPLALDVSIAKTGNEIYVVGENQDTCSSNPNVCEYAIFFRKSDDLGKTFGNQVNITLAQNPVELELAVSGSNIYVVWATYGKDGQELVFSRSNDSGHTFSAPVIISKPGDSEWPHVAADGKNVYVIWKSDNERLLANEGIANAFAHKSGIFFVKSNDGGSTFSQPLDISGDVGTSYFSGISVSNGIIYVSWTSKHGDNIQTFFSKSGNNGTTFDSPVDLTERHDTWIGQITSSDNNVYVAGSTSIPGDTLWFKASNDAGASFGPLTVLNEETLKLGPGTKTPPSEVYVSDDQNTSKIITLAEVAMPIVAGIAVGVFVFTRKKK